MKNATNARPKPTRLKKIFVANMVAEMRARGWTGIQFADLIGCTSQSVTNWKRYVVMPNFDRIERIATLFAVEPAELFRERKKKN